MSFLYRTCFAILTMLTPVIGQAAQPAHEPYPYTGGYSIVYPSNELQIEEGRLDASGNIVPPSRCKPAENAISYDIDEEVESAPPWCCNPYCPDPCGCWNYWPNLSDRHWYICTHHTRYYIRHMRGGGKH